MKASGMFDVQRNFIFTGCNKIFPGVSSQLVLLFR